MNDNIVIQNIKKFWISKSEKAKRNIIVSSVIFIALTCLLAFLYTRDSYDFLLTTDDATVSSNVISQLKEKGVKYDVRGKSIYVANTNADELKLELSGSGALSSSSSTIGLFTQSMFIDDTQKEQVIKKDLENNLSSVIKGYNEIGDCSVLLTLGQQSSFKAENIPSKAAIKLTLKSKLTNKQVQSIQKLAAAAVPNLDEKDVIITDNGNNLLSSNGDEDYSIEDDNSYVKAMEDKISGQIGDMLSIAFPDSEFKVVARVQMDFSKSQVDKESVQSGPDTIVSKQTSSESTTTNSTSAQAGTASNVTSYQTPTGANGEATQKQTEVINYELNKVKEQTIKSPEIKQMSVAVIANKTLSPQEEGKIKELVTTAALINQSRGDMVSIQGFEAPKATEQTVSNQVNQYVKIILDKSPIIVVLIFLLILLFRILGMIKKETPKEKSKESSKDSKGVREIPMGDINADFSYPKESVEIVAVNDVILQKQKEESKRVKEIIQDEIENNPQKVATILRTWRTSSERDGEE